MNDYNPRYTFFGHIVKSCLFSAWFTNINSKFFPSILPQLHPNSPQSMMF